MSRWEALKLMLTEVFCYPCIICIGLVTPKEENVQEPLIDAPVEKPNHLVYGSNDDTLNEPSSDDTNITKRPPKSLISLPLRPSEPSLLWDFTDLTNDETSTEAYQAKLKDPNSTKEDNILDQILEEPEIDFDSPVPDLENVENSKDNPSMRPVDLCSTEISFVTPDYRSINLDKNTEDCTESFLNFERS